jgi:hypothetical protein
MRVDLEFEHATRDVEPGIWPVSNSAGSRTSITTASPGEAWKADGEVSRMLARASATRSEAVIDEVDMAESPAGKYQLTLI